MMDASAAVSVILGSSQLGTPPKRSGTPVDVPNGWDPRTNKQPTGLFAYGAAHRRPVLVLLGTPPKKKPLLQTAGEMDPDRHSEWLGPAG